MKKKAFFINLFIKFDVKNFEYYKFFLNFIHVYTSST